MAQNQKTDTVRLQSMARAFISSTSLFAAIDLELFTAVANGASTPKAFANRTGISELNADRLMTMCSANGLLEWHGDGYVNASATSCRESPAMPVLGLPSCGPVMSAGPS